MKFIMLFLLHESYGFQERRNFLKIPLAVHTPEEKFCKNCKFFTETKFGHCSRFPFQQTDNYLVDGYKDESPINYYYCSTARSSDRMCGPEGRGFTPTTP